MLDIKEAVFRFHIGADSNMFRGVNHLGDDVNVLLTNSAILLAGGLNGCLCQKEQYFSMTIICAIQSLVDGL